MKYNEKPTPTIEKNRRYLLRQKNSQETYFTLAFWDDAHCCFYDYDRDGEKYFITLNEDDEWFDTYRLIRNENPYSLRNILKLISFSTTIVLHDRYGNRICAIELLNDNSKLFEDIMSVLYDATVTEIDRGKNDYEIILELDVQKAISKVKEK